MDRFLAVLTVLSMLLGIPSVATASTNPHQTAAQPADIRQADATAIPAPSMQAGEEAATPAPTGPARPNLAPIRIPAGTAVSPSVSISETITETNAETTVVATPAITGTEGVTDTTGGAADVPAVPAATPAAQVPVEGNDLSGALAGTIVANRTESAVRFFVDGQTYDLPPLRASGIPLARATAVLNLFNCDAGQLSAANPDCFWDPYLLTQDGFFEIVTGEEAGKDVNLTLREAGAPPANQIWVQNRTGNSESIVFNNEIVELQPATVQEFTVEGDGPVIVHLRNCLSQGEQTACEWKPQGIDPGYYYGLVKSEAVGPNDVQMVSFGLEGIVSASGEQVDQPPQATCRLRVPTLNVRGGPGLEFPVIAKVRGTEDQPGTVVVIGFDAGKEWMQVTERVAQDGWVTANPEYIICTGDLAALPVTATAVATPTPVPTPVPEIVAAPPEPAPASEAPVVVEAAPPAVEAPPAEPVAEAPAAEAPIEEAPPAETAPETATVAAIPPGLARIVVNNGFDQVMRFTLDQRFRVELDHPSGEWDLQPGDSINILVYPGMIAFSASTPWQSLADNADFFIDPDQERALWLYFVPDPDGSGRWILQY